MAERINFDTLDLHDVEMLVNRRLGWENGEGRKAAIMLVGAEGKGPATRLGHLAFVDAVCRRAKREADGEPITLEVFGKAIAKLEKSR